MMLSHDHHDWGEESASLCRGFDYKPTNANVKLAFRGGWLGRLNTLVFDEAASRALHQLYRDQAAGRVLIMCCQYKLDAQASESHAVENTLACASSLYFVRLKRLGSTPLGHDQAASAVAVGPRVC